MLSLIHTAQKLSESLVGLKVAKICLAFQDYVGISTLMSVVNWSETFILI